MDFWIQVIGGLCYLLNKVFFSWYERAKRKNNPTARRWRVWAWAVYIAGLPAWVYILIRWHNWIAASVEASGLPAMLLGLLTALRGKDSPPQILKQSARICIPLGLGYSLYDFGGLTTLNQWLEIGLVLGFLVGTYRLAGEHADGYLWFVLMHVTCGWLMWIQGYPWLFLQQIVSLGFIADAYATTQRRTVDTDL